MRRPLTIMGPLLIRPGAVLFSCTFNAVRSVMAENLTRLYFGHDMYIASAGVKLGEEVDPFVIAAMEELGVNVAGHHPHTFEELEDDSFDLIVTLSPESHHKALEFTRTLACDVLYWPTMDPTAVEGSRDRKLDAYREVREGLAKRIKKLFDDKPLRNMP